MLNSAYSTLGDVNGRAVYDSAVKRFRTEVGRFDGLPVSTWGGPSYERRALFVDETVCIGCRNCNHCAGDTFMIVSHNECAPPFAGLSLGMYVVPSATQDITGSTGTLVVVHNLRSIVTCGIFFSVSQLEC